MISKTLSGHLYANSVYESSDSCGNCNGGKCAVCTPRWRVWDLPGIFFEEQEALEAEAQYISKLSTLLRLEAIELPEGASMEEVDSATFYMKEGVLHADHYCHINDSKGRSLWDLCGDRTVRIQEDQVSSKARELYEAKLKEASNY